MNTLNINTSDTMNITPIMPFDYKNPSDMDIIAYTGLEEYFATGELLDANFCLLPPYCLIEDKHKYLAG